MMLPSAQGHSIAQVLGRFHPSNLHTLTVTLLKARFRLGGSKKEKAGRKKESAPTATRERAFAREFPPYREADPPEAEPFTRSPAGGLLRAQISPEAAGSLPRVHFPRVHFPAAGLTQIRFFWRWGILRIPRALARST
jgi:hypothetical protein